MDDRLSRDLASLIDLFSKEGWHEAAVRTGRLSLVLSYTAASRRLAEPARRDAVNSRKELDRPIQATPDEADRQDRAPIDPAWTVLGAPNLGTFYRSPKPGSPPFVTIGQRVDKGDELCLIEVMKLFTTVRADRAGIIRAIVADDAELVESGQALMYIEGDDG